MIVNGTEAAEADASAEENYRTELC